MRGRGGEVLAAGGSKVSEGIDAPGLLYCRKLQQPTIVGYSARSCVVHSSHHSVRLSLPPVVVRTRARPLSSSANLEGTCF